MSLPDGTWKIITNLHAATLNITADAQGNVTGTIKLSATETHNVSGTWNASQKKLTFSYSFIVQLQQFNLPIGFTYVGYELEAAPNQMFNQPDGPAPGGTHILAGTFEHTWFNFGSPQGWVARQQ